MLDEQILKIQNNKDKLFVLLFLYKRNIKINLATTDNDVAVYGKNCSSSFIMMISKIKICFNFIMRTIKRKFKNNNSKTKKNFLYNPNNPKKSFDVYIDKNPKDTIHIKYTTTQDVQNTIDMLEKIYKNREYTHKRIWQVAMIMKVRLEVLKNKKPQQYNIAKRYFNFLRKRTKLNDTERYKLIFTY